MLQAAREERRARERAERRERGEDEEAEPVARIVAYSDRCHSLDAHTRTSQQGGEL